MHRARKLCFGSILERIDDVHVDIETDNEGNTELEDNSYDSECNSVVSTPVLPTYLYSVVNRKLNEEIC